MRYTIRMITALVMAFSFVLASFAAPSMVGTVVDVTEVTMPETDAEQKKATTFTDVVGDNEILLKTWDFNTDGDAEGWKVVSSADGYSATVKDGSLAISCSTEKKDYRVDANSLSGFLTRSVTKLEIRLKGSVNNTVRIYYATVGNGNTFASKNEDGSYTSYETVASFEATDDWATVTIDAPVTADWWTGDLKSLRFQTGGAGNGGTVYIDYIKVYGYEKFDFLPGMNILTGTADALDFDGKEVIDGKNVKIDGANIMYFDKNGAIVDSPVATDTNNKVLELSGYSAQGSVYPQCQFHYHKFPGRPYLIKLDATIYDGDDLKDNIYGRSVRWGKDNDTASNGYLEKTKYSLIDDFTDIADAKWSSHYATDDMSTTALARVVFTLLRKESPAEAQAYNSKIYIDNIMYVPYYKVTYKNGSETVGEAWVLHDGNGNLVDSFVPTLQGVDLPEGKNGWALTPDGERANNVSLENKDITLYAVFENNVKPGINLLTNTKEPFGFEGDEGYSGTQYYKDKLFRQNTSYGRKMEVVTSPVEGETDNAVLKLYDISYYGNYDSYDKGTLKSVATYPSLMFDSLPIADDKRPFFVGAKMLIGNIDDGVATVNASNYGIRFAADSNVNLDVKTSYVTDRFAAKVFKSTEKAPQWTVKGFMDDTFAESYTTVSNGTTYTIAPSDTHSIISMNATYTVANVQKELNSKNEYITNKWVIADGKKEPHFYYDDLYVMPYYKVTYKSGEEVLDTAWVLDDGNGNILENFNPADYFEGTYPEGKNAWSFTDGGRPVEVVELDNEDIVLYAAHADIVPEIKENVVWAIEYNEAFDLTSGNKAHSYARAGYVTIENGNLVVAANEPSLNSDGSFKNWDSNIGFQTLDLDCSAVKKLEVRFKLTDVAEIKKNENGKFVYGDASYVGTTPLTQEAVKDKIVEFHYTTDTYRAQASYHGTYKSPETSLGSITPDEDGYYTVTYDTSNFKGWDTTITAVRFDVPETACTIHIDYFRMYGDEENFVPTSTAPEKRSGVAVRVDSPETTGIRFRAAVKNELRDDVTLAEYGWIVALAETLGDNELTHEFKATNGKASYKVGKAFCRADNIDNIYEQEDGYTVFTALMTGIPAQYADKYIVVRPYSLVGDAYIYGESRVTSPKEVGQKLYDKWDLESGDPEDTSYDYVKYKEFIDALGIIKY